jgi:transmembrane sensor
VTEGADWIATGAVESEAAAWIAQLNGEHWSEPDQAALREWCSRSPAHREALKRLGSIWAELDGLPAMRAALEATAPAATERRFRWNGFWAAHAAVLGVAVIGVSLWVALAVRGEGDRAVEFYATNVGQLQTIELRDHSTVRLNTNSLLEVTYRPDERRVRLVKGEALFEVAKDPKRPFLVNAAGSTVRAVGTRFSVRIRQDDVEVTVSEGVVALARSSNEATIIRAPDARAALVRPNEIAMLRDRAADPVKIASVDVHELERRLAWTAGILEFDGEPLEKVVAEISRYTPVKITIADAELRQIPVGGRFRVGETQALFDVIEASFGAKLVYEGDGVLITRK